MPIFIETLFALLVAFALGLLVAWWIWGGNRENQN
jgi:uncharacterized membrane protein YqjE